jgi:hypothetical protein
MDLGVTLSDYAVSGAGQGSAQDLALLNKALEAGDITGRDTETQGASGGAVLKVESLENTLKVLTTKESDIVLWKRIPKLPAYNTVEEYNQLVEYGSLGNSFNNEGELPEEDDSIYARKSQLVKYMGTTRVISHPMQLVSTMIGSVVQQQIQHGTLKILRDVNIGLTKADSNVVPEEFNGLYAQQKESFSTLEDYYNSEVVIDLKGQRLTEAVIEDAALSIIENNGEGSLLMAPPKVLSNFVKNFHESKLIQPNTAQVTDGVMGQAVNQFMSQFGSIELGYDKFMKSKASKTTASNATNLKAPSAPTAGGTPKAVVTDTLNKFGTAFAGDYKYAVSAINRYGESSLTVLGAASALTVAATESVDLQFTATAGVTSPTAYRIYRSEKDVTTADADTKFYPIFEVSAAELAAGFNGAAAGKVRDKNMYISNTEQAFLIDPSADVWSFKQLAPLMKMDLAQIGPATRFMILLYGTPMLYAPKKMVRFINIGIASA